MNRGLTYIEGIATRYVSSALRYISDAWHCYCGPGIILLYSGAAIAAPLYVYTSPTYEGMFLRLSITKESK